MSWIKTIGFEDAEGKLKKIYKKVSGADNNIDNVLKIHSLRPHTLTGHMALYKNVLHNSNNTLPKWYLETIGVYVSYLNKCSYCVDHHFAGLQRLLQDDELAQKIMESITNNSFNSSLDPKFINGMAYAKKLTLNLNEIQVNDIDRLRTIGFSDGEILEINQVTSYFNYANRTVLGLGVNTTGDILGLSPNNSDEQDNWTHS